MYVVEVKEKHDILGTHEFKNKPKKEQLKDVIQRYDGACTLHVYEVYSKKELEGGTEENGSTES